MLLDQSEEFLQGFCRGKRTGNCAGLIEGTFSMTVSRLSTSVPCRRKKPRRIREGRTQYRRLLERFEGSTPGAAIGRETFACDCDETTIRLETRKG